MKICCISDIHGYTDEIQLPKADILIVAGDLTSSGTVNQLISINQWFGKIKDNFKYGVVTIPGNHDWLFEKNWTLAKTIVTNATVLHNNGTIIEGLKFWGSAATPRFFDWAFNFDRGADIKRVWDLIPGDTDVLITHGPPYGIGDRTYRAGHVGCSDLLNAVRKVSPKLHIFGHIHSDYGDHGKSLGTHFVNAAICTEQYQPLNKPIVVDL